jgi:hypothetical protein
MPLTDPSQAALGNTLKVDDHDLTIVDVIQSGNGGLLVLKSPDSPLCVVAHAGDIIDGENVSYMSGPTAPGQGVEAASREAAQDAEIQSLKARVAELSQQAPAPAPVQEPEAPPAQPAQPSTEATGATDAPGTAPTTEGDQSTTTIQEG